MKISNFDIHPVNYNKKTPRTLKGIADFLLATILIIDPLILSMPDFPHKEWILWGWSVFVVLFKFFTKLVTEA